MLSDLGSKSWPWILPIFITAILTPFTPYLDLHIAQYFYNWGKLNNTHFVSHPLFDFFYSYAILPGQITVVLSLIALFCSYVIPFCSSWKKPSLVLLLTLVIGAGFICHFILKDHWGRPRPKQVIEFGGNQSFRPYYKPNFFKQSEPSKSFPSGHCTMGFYFFAVAILAARQGWRLLFYLGLILAIVLGTALGITRIAQGGHFFSDVIFSAVLMWLTALSIERMVYRRLNRLYANS
jgi:lipid A 4'-phosphatase